MYVSMYVCMYVCMYLCMFNIFLCMYCTHCTLDICDLVAPLVFMLCTNMKKVNLSIHIFEIQNILFILIALNNFKLKKLRLQTCKISIVYTMYFSLTCNTVYTLKCAMWTTWTKLDQFSSTLTGAQKKWLNRRYVVQLLLAIH